MSFRRCDDGFEFFRIRYGAVLAGVFTEFRRLCAASGVRLYIGTGFRYAVSSSYRFCTCLLCCFCACRRVYAFSAGRVRFFGCLCIQLPAARQLVFFQQRSRLRIVQRITAVIFERTLDGDICGKRYQFF